MIKFEQENLKLKVRLSIKRTLAYLFSPVLTFAFLNQSVVFAQTLPISHIEWAAANYAAKNTGDPVHQFAAVRASIDELLADFAPRGVIYVNDLDSKGVELTINHIAEYLAENKIQSSILKALPSDADLASIQYRILLVPYAGDILNLKPPKTTTANLRNPEPFIVNALTTQSNWRIKNPRLMEMANASQKGLSILTYDPNIDPRSVSNWVEGLIDNGAIRVPTENTTYYDFSNSRGQKMNQDFIKFVVPNDVAPDAKGCSRLF